MTDEEKAAREFSKFERSEPHHLGTYRQGSFEGFLAGIAWARANPKSSLSLETDDVSYFSPGKCIMHSDCLLAISKDKYMRWGEIVKALALVLPDGPKEG